jgi:hypothetical protein
VAEDKKKLVQTSFTIGTAIYAQDQDQARARAQLILTLRQASEQRGRGTFWRNSRIQANIKFVYTYRSKLTGGLARAHPALA